MAWVWKVSSATATVMATEVFLSTLSASLVSGGIVIISA